LTGGQMRVGQRALVREAAYEMLTRADREAGQRIAAQWLDRVGQPGQLGCDPARDQRDEDRKAIS
jgi:hypothetical protein